MINRKMQHIITESSSQTIRKSINMRKSHYVNRWENWWDRTISKISEPGKEQVCGSRYALNSYLDWNAKHLHYTWWGWGWGWGLIQRDSILNPGRESLALIYQTWICLASPNSCRSILRAAELDEIQRAEQSPSLWVVLRNIWWLCIFWKWREESI